MSKKWFWAVVSTQTKRRIEKVGWDLVRKRVESCLELFVAVT